MDTRLHGDTASGTASTTVPPFRHRCTNYDFNPSSTPSGSVYSNVQGKKRLMQVIHALDVSAALAFHHGLRLPRRKRSLKRRTVSFHVTNGWVTFDEAGTRSFDSFKRWAKAGYCETIICVQSKDSVNLVVCKAGPGTEAILEIVIIATERSLFLSGCDGR
jgi:hypothetical protein